MKEEKAKEYRTVKVESIRQEGHDERGMKSNYC